MITKIFELYEKSDKEAETYTRFNIYDLGQVLLDDHRSKESFMERYRFSPEPVTDLKSYKSQKKEIERWINNCNSITWVSHQ